jgi:predicted O-methyltransferase YrrM
MYSSLTLLKKYLQYLFNASNGKGHGVHSPFVFTFIKEVLNKKADNALIASIEKQRGCLEQDNELVKVWDRGAGSRQTEKNERTVRQIAKVALKPKKYSQLLYKIAAYYKPNDILEMGTSLGITTCYLAAANSFANVVTMEGAPNVDNIARNTFSKVGVNNIQIIEGNFDQTLSAYLSSINFVGLAYVDGNHRYEPTVAYFESLLQKSNDDTILIFDDIHWSQEMEQAWDIIKANPSVTLTIDLFFIGLVFVRKANKEKEHFIIRY